MPIPSHRFLIVGLVLLFAFHAPSRAQEKVDPEALTKKRTFELLEKAKDEYRTFFKKPDTTYEFWAAIKFEMDLGKFDLAALHLKLLLEKDAKDVDPDLVKIEAAEGMSAFLRLDRVREWSDHPPFQKEAVENVDKLIKRVTEAVHTHLSDPVRIRKFINQLDARTDEERRFAVAQLARSRERAVPYLIEALRVNYGKPLFAKVRDVMLLIGPETVPVYLECFKAANDKDYKDVELRATLLDIIQARDDKRVIPYLWHMYASKKYPDVIRTKAKATLASLLRVRLDDVPPAKESLTYLAERYYQHKVPLGKGIEIYEWDGDKINTPADKFTPANAEKLFCERYAREALELDSSYVPAQDVLLSLTLERTFRTDVDQMLLKGPPGMPPKMRQLLTTIDANLAMRVLERALDDKQLPVILPLVMALSERVEMRAVRVTEAGKPRGLARALYYPDRRVQFAAMTGLPGMPEGGFPPVVAGRIVDLSRRFVASDLVPKALIVNAPEAQLPGARMVAKALGYESTAARGAVKAVEEGKRNADYDLVILYRGVADLDFQRVYSQIRNHEDLGGLPMIVVVETGPEARIAKLEDELLADNATLDKAQARWEIDKKTIDAAPEAIRAILKTDRADRSENELRSLATYFRASWEKDRRTLDNAPLAVRQILFTDAKRRTDTDRRDLEVYFRSTWPEFRSVVDQIVAARRLPDPAKAARSYLASNPNVLVVTEDKFQAGDDLKNTLEGHFRSAQIVKLTPPERSFFSDSAMNLLVAAAQGQIKGYDVSPALPEIFLQLNSPRNARGAIEILAKVPGKESQYRLAGLAGDPKREDLRVPAANALNRHIQAHGLSLDKKQIDDLKLAHQETPDGSPLRVELNVTMSTIARPTVAKTGNDLLNFRADPPAAPKEK